LEAHSLDAILKKSWKRERKEKIDAYLDVILRANPKTNLEVHKMRAATFEEVFTEAGIIPEWIERGRQQGTEQGKEITARNLLKMGMPVEEIAQATELPIEKVMQMRNEQ
jgi:predicted transposase/invertase (TIGR01784 family)